MEIASREKTCDENVPSLHELEKTRELVWQWFLKLCFCEGVPSIKRNSLVKEIDELSVYGAGE